MSMLYKQSYLSSLLNRYVPIPSHKWQSLPAALTLNITQIILLLENLFSKKVKDKLFPDADFSSTTVFMELRGANQVTELYPKEFE
jgi:hypothetical protein